ncbi:hypothetical protein SAMN05428981_1011269 [Bacillus sp. OV194]|nr:hypothetical protein SAMN05428981_1011269 [Bacillus sp. OV194]
MTQTGRPFTQEEYLMMKRIVSSENTLHALKRVEKNKGSHGVDEMPVALKGKASLLVRSKGLLHDNLNHVHKLNEISKAANMHSN